MRPAIIGTDDEDVCITFRTRVEGDIASVWRPSQVAGDWPAKVGQLEKELALDVLKLAAFDLIVVGMCVVAIRKELMLFGKLTCQKLIDKADIIVDTPHLEDALRLRPLCAHAGRADVPHVQALLVHRLDRGLTGFGLSGAERAGVVVAHHHEMYFAGLVYEHHMEPETARLLRQREQ